MPSVYYKFYHSQLPYTWLDSHIYGACLALWHRPLAYVERQH